MTKIVLNEYGVETTLTEIRHYLEDALYKTISKKQKDRAISKALGAVEALFYIVDVIENDSNDESKLET